MRNELSIRAVLLSFFLCCSAGNSAVAYDRASPIAIPAAEQAFLRAHKICVAENGKLWNRSLCGPMMFVDEGSRVAILNHSVPGATKRGAVWHVTLPSNLPLANTAVEYNGQRWTMLLWPLPTDTKESDILLMHESFHRVQPELGLPAGSGMEAANGHLDTREGRIWLRAELHALRAALIEVDDNRKTALTDALVMRTYRRSLWPAASGDERELELVEGLAESTGIDAALQDSDSRVRAAIKNIGTSEMQPSFVRSFAYATGAAYGQLLNTTDPAWRRRVTRTFDFGPAVAEAQGITMPMVDKTAAELALYRNNGSTITAEENVRAERTAMRNLRYELMFVTGRTVTFPLIKSQTSFDPRQVMSFPGHGNVYSVIRVNDVWGMLNVTGAYALTSPEFSKVTLPVTEDLTDGKLIGEDWSATIKKTFMLASDPDKPGSYVIVDREKERDGEASN